MQLDTTQPDSPCIRNPTMAHNVIVPSTTHAASRDKGNNGKATAKTRLGADGEHRRTCEAASTQSHCSADGTIGQRGSKLIIWSQQRKTLVLNNGMDVEGKETFDHLTAVIPLASPANAPCEVES